MCSHAAGTLPFSEADRQAVQEAEATPGLQSWLRVQIAKGLGQRLRAPHTPQQQTAPPALTVTRLHQNCPEVHPVPLPLSILQASFPPPGTHLLAGGHWVPESQGTPFWGGLGLHMGDGPWVLGLDVRIYPGLSEPRTIMAEERTRRVGVRGCPKDCALCGAVCGMPGPSVARWRNGLPVPGRKH